MKKIWQFFCSLKLTIYLGLGLCVLLWIGSGYFLYAGEHLAVLDQKLLIPWLWQQSWGGLITNWWLWVLLLGLLLLAINTFVCSTDRLTKLIPRLFTPKMDVTPQWLAGLAIKQDVILSAPFEDVRTYLHRVLQFKGVKNLHCQEQENGSYLIHVQKGRWMSLAPYVVHLGFLIVLIGHLLSNTSGFKSFGHWVGVGEKFSLPSSSLWLRVEGVDPCVEGETDSYCSEVTLGEGTEILHEDWLGVNKPVFYGGLNIYQLSWAQEAVGIQLTITKDGESKKMSLLPEEKKEIAPGISLLPYMLIPDFTFGPDGQPSSRSRMYNNPALLIMMLENGMPGKRAWLFLYKPEFQEQVYKGIKIKFSGLATHSSLLLNVTRNPGAMTVLIGGVLFILSSAWFLLGNHRRLWFYLERQEGQVQLTCAGMSTQRKARLRAKLAYVCNTLEKHFSQNQ